MDIGPKLDWTRDVGIYDRYLDWHKRCEFVFESALLDVPEPVKYSYLKFWLGEEGVPSIKKWESTNKLVYTRVGEIVPSGHKCTTFWNLLEEEFKPRSSTFV